MKRAFYSLVVLWGMFLAIAYAAASPDVMLKTTADRVITELKKSNATLKDNPALVSKIIQKNVLPIVDVPAMSRSVVKPTVWEQATPDQKQRFTRSFTRLVIDTYAGALAKYTNESVIFLGTRPGMEPNRVQVFSRIERNSGPSIDMSYRLIQRGGQWRVYDITVEGVSLLESFRSQFASQLAQNNFEYLIQQLEHH